MPDNVSEQLSDKAASYQLDILRVEAGMRKDVLTSLKGLENDLLSKLIDGPKLSKSKQAQIEKTLRATSATIKDVYDQIGKKSVSQLKEIAKATTAKTTKDLSGALGVSMGEMQLSPAQITSIVNGPVMEGNPMAAWWNSQADKTTRRINGEIQQGLFLGEDIGELSKRIRGTKANGFKDGAIEATKRESEAITRTAVQSVANTAKIETFNNADSDVVKGIEWVSTLDNRTTAICRSLDGLTWTLPDYEPEGHDKAFPGVIAHWGCRSTQIAKTASWSDLAGKKIPDVTKGATYEQAFKKNLEALGMNDTQRAAAVANQRASMDGGVSDSLDFDGWARKKGDKFIKGLIGPSRFNLWKKNNLTMRDLTDQSGRELTVKELTESVATGKPTPETEGKPPAPTAEETKAIADAEALKIAKAEVAAFNAAQIAKKQAEIDKQKAINDAFAAKQAALEAQLAAEKAKEIAIEKKKQDDAKNDLADIIANPKGQTLKAKFAKKVQAEDAHLSPANQLLKVEILASEAQAAASLSSKLSGAKKKLLDDKKPTPSQQAAIDSLDPETKAAFEKTIGDAKIADAHKLMADMGFADTSSSLTKPKHETEGQDAFFPDPTTLETVRTLPGSTNPLLMRDPITGKQWVVKNPDQGGGGIDHLKSEATADALYRLAGANVPESQFGTDAAGKPYKIAEFIDVSVTLDQWEKRTGKAEFSKTTSQLQEHFVMDSLLGNWDVAGQSNDNILVHKGKKAFRVDNGGSLTFRAQGAKKAASDWSKTVSELDTLRDPKLSAGKTSEIFAGITKAEIDSQINEISKIKDKLIARFAETESTAATKVFTERIEYLEGLVAKKDSPATKAATKKAMSKAVAAHDGTDLGAAAKLADKSRINGFSIDVGSDHIEDLQGLVWTEKDISGDDFTVLRVKVTDKGSKRMISAMPDNLKDAGDGSGAPAPKATTKHPADEYNTTLVNLAKTMATHAGDGEYNKATVKKAEIVHGFLVKKHNAELKKIKKNQDPELIKMYEYYIEKGEGLFDKLQADNLPDHIPPEGYVFKPKEEKKKPIKKADLSQPFTGKRGTAFDQRGTLIKDGRATQVPKDSIGLARLANDVYDLEFPDGSTVNAIKRGASAAKRTGLALEGTVTVRVPGTPTKSTIESALAKLETLGIKTAPASDDTKEFVWLQKTVAVNKLQNDSLWKKIARKKDSPAKIEEARDFISLSGITGIPKRGEKGYTANGVTNSFGDGYRVTYRADLTREAIESHPDTKDLSLYHNTSGAVVDVIDSMLNSGGEATSTTERIRKGVNVNSTGGMSSDTDINTGGASYFFTRIKEKGTTSPGLYFKIGNIARSDAITYDHDKYGRISALKDRFSKPADFKKIAATGGGDETLFKNSLFLLDELEEIRVFGKQQQDGVIDTFKKHGITHLSDGRKIESIVKQTTGS